MDTERNYVTVSLCIVSALIDKIFVQGSDTHRRRCVAGAFVFSGWSSRIAAPRRQAGSADTRTDDLISSTQRGCVGEMPASWARLLV